MATIYVRNVPDELYKALREQARQHQRSIAAEVRILLEENIPTARELKTRRASFRRLERLASQPSPSRVPFPTTKEMISEDRSR